MGKRILITGGGGFAGQHLVNKLQTVDPTAKLFIPRSREVNLTDGAAVNELLTKVAPDEIYQLASIATVGESFTHPRQVIDNNFQLTLNVLEAMRQVAPKAKMLFVSSADIYDHAHNTPIDETRALAPVSPYSASKAAQDLLAASYQLSFGLNIVRARPFNHIGPGQKQGFVVADFAAQIAKLEKSDTAEKIITVGNLETVRDFTDVRDMVTAYILLMAQGKSGEVYNIGSGVGVTIKTILDDLLALATTPITEQVDQQKLRPSDNPQIIADNTKIARLGWQPTIPLKQTLTDILNYWRDIID